MSELVRHDPQQPSLEEQMNYSKALAAASIIPREFQNSPANVLVAIGYAQALGEHPISALTDVYIVNGRPSMSAAMMHRRALEAGHRVRVTATEDEATASIWRKDDPSFEHRVTWTLDRAKASGLTKNPVWKTFSSAMLRARAISEACRLACPEVLGAAKYLPDEIGGAFADAPGEVVTAEPSKPTGPTTKVSRRKPKAEPVDAEVVDPAPETDTPDTSHVPPSQAQFRALYAVMQDDGVDTKDKPAIYRWLGERVGREITSGNDLTKDEASHLIEQAQNTAAASEYEEN